MPEPSRSGPELSVGMKSTSAVAEPCTTPYVIGALKEVYQKRAQYREMFKLDEPWADIVDAPLLERHRGLAAAGLIQEAEFPEVAEAREALRAMAAGLPRLLEIKHRHPVALGDGFLMHPGFENFEPVSAGRLLAQDVRGDVRSPESGRLLLPLYQAQGDDGFFLIRELPVSE